MQLVAISKSPSEDHLLVPICSTMDPLNHDRWCKLYRIVVVLEVCMNITLTQRARLVGWMTLMAWSWTLPWLADLDDAQLRGKYGVRFRWQLFYVFKRQLKLRGRDRNGLLADLQLGNTISCQLLLLLPYFSQAALTIEGSEE